MRFGVRMPAHHPIREMIACVRRAEAAGFDAAWFPDSHLNYRDVWTTLGAVAVSSERIQIGPTVTNLVSRHVTVTASAARAVSEAAPGRFLLGIGAGDSAIGFDGMRNSKLAEMREGVARLRALMAGEGVTFGDFEARLRDAHEHPPIYMAGSGPKTLELAGAIADGAIVMLGDIPRKIGDVRRGAEAADRPAPPVFAYTMGAIVEDIERASKAFKAGCVRTAQLEGVRVFEEAGVRVELPPGGHVMGAKGDIGHAASHKDVAHLVEDLVSDEAALWYARSRTLVGSEADIRARLEVLREQGLCGVTMTEFSGSKLPDRLIETIGPLVRTLAA